MTETAGQNHGGTALRGSRAMGTGLSATVVARVAHAVMRLPRLRGQGVLVPGGFVLTAAHCVGWTAEDLMVLDGESFREPLETADGRELVATPWAVEPVKDLAVLGVMDDQAHSKEADAFRAFCEATPPVPLAIEAPVLFDKLPAFVFTHDQGVVAGTVQLCSPAAAELWFHTDRPINGGTSGGPVLSRAGKLWGVCSNIGSVEEGKGPSDGSIPRAHLAAPVWLVRRMVAGRVRRQLDAVLSRHQRNPRRSGRPPSMRTAR